MSAANHYSSPRFPRALAKSFVVHTIIVTDIHCPPCLQMDELATSAVKEEVIETKLAAISGEWAATSLTFADYKTRGPVVLKVCSVEVYILEENKKFNRWSTAQR